MAYEKPGSKSQFMEQLELVGIDYTLSPFTRNVFKDVVGYLILGIGNTLPYDPIFVFNWSLIIGQEVFLSKGVVGLVFPSPIDP